jgi:uncharacterized protein YcbK (DUF882 family)
MPTKLTKNFNVQEFDCKDGTPVPVGFYDNLQLLAENLQVLRNFIGEPIHITSGFRTTTYNKKVGGKVASKHLIALAGDFTTKNYSPKQLFTIITKLIKEGKMKEGGLHAYPGFLHYDPRGTKARW